MVEAVSAERECPTPSHARSHNQAESPQNENAPKADNQILFAETKEKYNRTAPPKNKKRHHDGAHALSGRTVAATKSLLDEHNNNVNEHTKECQERRESSHC